MNREFETGMVWFRRDLRIFDNAALSMALQSCRHLYCVFIFDQDILDVLPRQDRRVEFIRESLVELDATIRSYMSESGLVVRTGIATTEVLELVVMLNVQAVFAGHDDEPQSLVRDARVADLLRQNGAVLRTCKEHVIFERREILTHSGNPYVVFTPYKKTWLSRLTLKDCKSHPTDGLHLALMPRPSGMNIPSLAEIGFAPSNLQTLDMPIGISGGKKLIENFLDRMDRYDQTRDFPAIKGPSYLGIHLRFGTVSIRQLVFIAWQRMMAGSMGATVWLGELIWRDFYFSILSNFPHIVNCAFKPAYDAIVWENGEAAHTMFKAWCCGQTGYPLVDAAMAQLNQTGYMHNRLRMVAGSFLVKDLGIDWRWGERYFAENLNDFDLAANNGGWQWVSSSGCDAQPYFRIFNPVKQSEKFDPHGKFIRRYFPVLTHLSPASIHAPWLAAPLTLKTAGVILGENYPMPIISHELARTQTLKRYAVVKS